MRFKGLDLNLLVALDALLTEGSVTGAAERLHLSQSAVSCALARLRDTLGDDLLVQSGKKMVCTPYADELRPQLREILMRVDAAMCSGPGFTPATSTRHFRMVASDYVAEVVLGAAMVEVCRLAPGVRIDLLPLVTDDVFADLQQGNIDLIIAPDHYCHPANSRQSLFEDSFACLAWAENPAAGKRLDLQGFVDADHVVLKPYGVEQAIDELFFRQRGIERKVTVTASAFAMLPRLLVGSHRLATLPRRFAELYQRTLPLKIIDTDFAMPAIVETLQWHGSREKDKALAWLRQQIAAAAGPRGTATP